MPNPILLNTPSALGSQVPNIKNVMDICVARGFEGVRMPVAVSNYPFSNSSNLNVIDTSAITTLITYANSIGVGIVQLVFGYGPKISQVLADTFNSGRLWPNVTRPPQCGATTIGVESYTSLWNYIGRVVWQQLFDAAWNARGSVTLIAEKFNEVGADGVGGFAIWSSTFTYLSGEFAEGPDGNQYVSLQNGNLNKTPASNPLWWAVVPKGTIEAAFASYANDTDSVVNWRGVTQLGLTLEGSGTTEATTELNSITGATWTTYWSRQSRVATNRYAQAYAGAIYSEAGMKSQYSTRLGEQLTRITAHAIVGGKTKAVSEFGIRVDNCPRCTHPNTVRQHLVDQVRDNEAGIVQGGLYTCFNVSTSPTAGDLQYFTYNLDKTPLVDNGVSVAVTG